MLADLEDANLPDLGCLGEFASIVPSFLAVSLNMSVLNIIMFQYWGVNPEYFSIGFVILEYVSLDMQVVHIQHAKLLIIVVTRLNHLLSEMPFL